MAPKNNTTTVELPFDLTDDELRDRGAEQARKLQERAAVDEERKDKAKSYKDRIDEIDAKIATLADAIVTGRELRPVVCEWVADNARAVMNLVRTDFGTVVQSRPMTEAEKQRAMFDVTPAIARAAQDLRDAVPEGSSLSVTTSDGQTTTVADKRKPKAAAGE